MDEQAKENVPPSHGFKFSTNIPNRRHTLVPSKSILKPTLDDNNTIAVIPGNKQEKRRVSFAPEVTLHKITTGSRLSLRRQSLITQAGKSILKPQVVGEDYSQTITRVKPLIDEDDSTQTMDITHEVKAVPVYEDKDDTVLSELDAENLFREAVREMQETEMSQSQSQSDMELTQPVQPAQPAQTEQGLQIDDATKTMTMTFTPTKHTLDMDDSGHTSKRARLSQGTDSETDMSMTEIVPLAEVSVFSGEETQEEDDDYENVTLNQFLKEVDVQFFDAIGPSDRELVVDDFNQSYTASLMDYVKAVNSIPEFQYFEHLIGQYQNSIKNIRGIVLDFENSVKENNPTSIREYYEQAEELQRDLKIDYQALAGYARQQAKNENLQYLSHLLDQLKKSYEHLRNVLDVQLVKAIEIDKAVMTRQQELIVKKEELKRQVEGLQQKKHSTSEEERAKCKEVRNAIDRQKSQKADLEKEVELLQEQVVESASAEQTQNEQDNKLQAEIDSLQARLNGLRSPTEGEIEVLQKKFADEEKRSRIKLVSLDENELTVCVMNAVEVHVDMNTSAREVEVHSQYSEFEPLIQEMQNYYQNMQYDSLKEYLLEVRNSWTKFSSLLHDLRTMRLRYETTTEGTGLDETDVMALYKRGKYRMTIKYKVKDLIQFENQINVQADMLVIDESQEFKESAVLEETIAKSQLEIATMRRFIV